MADTLVLPRNTWIQLYASVAAMMELCVLSNTMNIKEYINIKHIYLTVSKGQNASNSSGKPPEFAQTSGYSRDQEVAVSSPVTPTDSNTRSCQRLRKRLLAGFEPSRLHCTLSLVSSSYNSQGPRPRREAVRAFSPSQIGSAEGCSVRTVAYRSDQRETNRR